MLRHCFPFPTDLLYFVLHRNRVENIQGLQGHVCGRGTRFSEIQITLWRHHKYTIDVITSYHQSQDHDENQPWWKSSISTKISFNFNLSFKCAKKCSAETFKLRPKNFYLFITLEKLKSKYFDLFSFKAVSYPVIERPRSKWRHYWNHS